MRGGEGGDAALDSLHLEGVGGEEGRLGVQGGCHAVGGWGGAVLFLSFFSNFFYRIFLYQVFFHQVFFDDTPGVVTRSAAGEESFLFNHI